MRHYCFKIEMFKYKFTVCYNMENKSLFIEHMGDSPQIRILDFLITERNIDFNITDMAKNAGIGRATLYRIWKDLIKNKIIIKTREIGNSKLYKLNESSQFIKKIIELDNELVMDNLKLKIKEPELKVGIR